MASFDRENQSSSPSDHCDEIMEAIEYMGSTSVDIHDIESISGNISDEISGETEHDGSTCINERNEYHDNEITLEDSPFIPKLNDESSIEDATNRCFQRGQIFKDKEVLYDYLKPFSVT